MLKAGFTRLMEHKWEYIPPLAAFLVAFALRHHFLVTYHYPMMIHEQDAVGYMDVAKNFLHMQLPSVSGRPPGYPVVIALFALLPVELEYAARLASIFMDALIVFPLFFIARIYLSRFESLAACLLWAFFSFSLVFSPSPLSQSSYLCYLLSGIALLQRGLEKKEIWWFSGAGACMALSYLARPEGIVGFACGFLICLTTFIEKDGLNKKNVLMPACFLLGFLLLAGPYLITLRINLGSWTLSALSETQLKSADFVLTLNATGELQKTGTAGMSLWEEYYKTLPIFLNAVLANMRGFVGVYVKTFPIWMHLMTGVGILALIWKNPWRNSAVLLILVAVIAPACVVNIPKTHSYIYPVFVLTFVCFVSCFEAVDKVACRVFEMFLPVVKLQFPHVFLSGILLLTISFVALAFYRDAHGHYQSSGLVTEALTTEKIYKGAGEIIKNNSQAHDVIMTRWGLVGYFAARPVLTLPKGGVKEVIDYGRKNGARFILIDTNSVLSRRQELRELLGPLEGKPVNPDYGIETFDGNFFPDLGGYVIYRYKQ